MRITNGEYVRYPKWSYDGNWVAYIRGIKGDETSLYQGDLWLYDLKSNTHFRVASNVTGNFQWAPNQNIIGFQSDKVLKITDVESLNHHQTIASGIINFSWLPDGRGLLTSSKLGESVFSDILLTKMIQMERIGESGSRRLIWEQGIMKTGIGMRFLVYTNLNLWSFVEFTVL